jgi:ABC-type sugar transport system permease subunit
MIINERRQSISKLHRRMGWLFVLPWIIGFFAFFLYPMIYSLVISFSNVSTEFSISFAGLKNYDQALLREVNFIPLLINSIGDTMFNLPIVLVFSLFLAIMINRKSILRPFFSSAFFLPILIGTGVVMETILGTNIDRNIAASVNATQLGQSGFLNLQGISMTGQLNSLLGQQLAGLIQNILDKISAALWISGIQTIIFIGALQSIPVSYYEAAYCDGATEWEKFWMITLPMITPTILLNIIYTLIESFTNGNNKLVRYILDVTFKGSRLAYGSAVSWIYFIVIGFFIGIVFFFMRNRIYKA